MAIYIYIYVLGIFHNNFLPFEHLRNKTEKGVPSLGEMTITAINLLMKNTNGFLLMVNIFCKPFRFI